MCGKKIDETEGVWVRISAPKTWQNISPVLFRLTHRKLLLNDYGNCFAFRTSLLVFSHL